MEYMIAMMAKMSWIVSQVSLHVFSDRKKSVFIRLTDMKIRLELKQTLIDTKRSWAQNLSFYISADS